MTVMSHISMNADIPAKMSIHHWQLRNLLCKGSKNRLLYICDDRVLSLPTERPKDSSDIAEPGHVAQFDFEPRCIASAENVIAVGGQDGGEFSFLVEGALRPEVHTMELGGSINNSICIYDDTAIVCNNDRTIKHVSLGTRRLLENSELPTAVNHASISPSKSHLLAVGDRAEAYFFSRSSGSSWSMTRRLDASTDALFATAFHPTRPIFAAGSQDGSVLLWDQRYLSTPFHTLSSTRPHHPSGAVRAIHFSPAPLDLMVFTEASGYAHVVDVRGDAYEEELLRLGRREIAGCAWRDDGSRVYVGCADGITEWKITGRDRFVFPAVKLR